MCVRVCSKREGEGIKDREREKETGEGGRVGERTQLRLVVAVILCFTFNHAFDPQCSAEQV